MKISPLGEEQVAHKVVSLTSRPDHKSEEFDDVVHEIVKDTQVVYPYIFQYGRYPRVPGKDMCSYVLEPEEQDLYYDFEEDHSDVRVELEEKLCKEEYLLDEVNEYLDDLDNETTVLLLDVLGYGRDVIDTLPDDSRIFVLFRPYSTELTVPIIEAKLHLERKTSEKKQTTSGIERIRIK